MVLSLINRETLHEKRGEPGVSSSTKRMEDQESALSSSLLNKVPDRIKDKLHNLLVNGVVAHIIVGGSILLTIHKLLQVQ